MKKVIVLGSLNMDLTIGCDQLPQGGETVEGYAFFTNPGGKGGNQAVAAAKLGALTYMLARVGNDAFGEQVCDSLRQYQVNTAQIGVSAKLSTGVAMITRHDGDNRIILSSGANHEMCAQDVVQTLDAVAQAGDIFVTQLECALETVLAALESAKSRGLFTVLNPAPAKELPAACYHHIDLIVVNQTECEFLTGYYPQNAQDCAKPLQIFAQRGAGGAIITLGSQGSIYSSAQETVSTQSYRLPVVDTTAAGDTYIGALVCALAQNQTMEQGMQFASKAAALTVTKHGAQQSIPTKEEVEHFFAADD